MALSNILREPRREITESAVGMGAAIVVVGGFLVADYFFALWFVSCFQSTPARKADIALAMLAGVPIGLVCFMAVLLTYTIGESICNALQRNGIHLRPRNRPRQ